MWLKALPPPRLTEVQDNQQGSAAHASMVPGSPCLPRCRRLLPLSLLVFAKKQKQIAPGCPAWYK